MPPVVAGPRGNRMMMAMLTRISIKPAVLLGLLAGAVLGPAGSAGAVTTGTATKPVRYHGYTISVPSRIDTDEDS